MHTGLSRVLSVAVLLGAVTARTSADLASYIARPEPQYHWEKVSETQEGFVTVTDLKLRSQVWRGIPWDHTIRLFRPVMVKYPKTALLLVWGGNPSTEDNQIASLVSVAIQAPLAFLYNIPNQPLFGGKTEDDLIAHTYAEYLKSGDDTWPLLEPMTKSAIKAMDALQAYSEQAWKQKIEGFVVTGASKRGWTTYLTGASDPRVKGIAPMVFDNLNFAAQMPHQLALWGQYSEQIEDYTRRGLQQQLGSKRGQQLIRMVDPWFYRDRLKMPKLLVHGANDRYWATDATSVYWKDLPGEKSLLIAPNSGHGLEDRPRVIASTVAFFHHVAGNATFPELTASSEKDGSKRILRVRSTVKPTAARLWVAHSDSLDFRPAKWESTPMKEDGGSYVGEVSVPDKGGVAWFGELEFAGPSGPYNLSTPAHVAPEPRPAAVLPLPPGERLTGRPR
jgi:PhoPQ-activated pathogenicity-related protein